MSTHSDRPARNDAGLWAQTSPPNNTEGGGPKGEEPPRYDKGGPPGGGGGGGGDYGHHGHEEEEAAAGGSQLCAHVPEFKRLNYFYGQMLGAADFRAEQDYFREKMKLHNRCLHGYGVVCGLRVVPVPSEGRCAPEEDARLQRLREELKRREEIVREAQARGDQGTVAEQAPRIEELRRELEKIRAADCEEEEPTRVVVECGLALDCEGNELVVRRPLTIDLWRELSRADRDRVKDDADGKQPPKNAAGGKGQGEGGEYKAGGGGEYEGEGEEPGPTANGHEEGPGEYGEEDGGENGEGGEYGRGEGHYRKRRGSTLYVSICYCEQPTDPVRPVMPEACGLPPECSYGKTRDSVRVKVTYDPPDVDERCATCCEGCADKCLLLARVDNFRRGEPLRARNVHNEVRRPVSLYVPTVITGISWTDGADYTEGETETLLGLVSTDAPGQPKGHMLVRFSRPVHVSTIRRGVVDVWVTQGGGGRHADIFNMDIEYVDLPASGMTDRVRFRAVSDESPNPGDRVMIVVRGSRLLDACCRPVDAANTGGRTPFVPDKEFREFRRASPTPECQYPPPFGYGPWTSGTNAAGSDFVSWFYIKQNPSRQKY